MRIISSPYMMRFALKNMNKKLNNKKLQKNISIDFNMDGNYEQVAYDAAVNRVISMVEQGLFQESLHVLQLLKTRVSKDVRTRVLLLRVFGFLQDHQSAKEAFAHLNKKFRGDVMALNAMALYCREFGEICEAVALLEKSLIISPQNIDGLKHMGICISMQGDFPCAESYFRKALRVAPSDAELYWLLIYQRRDCLTDLDRDAMELLLSSGEFIGGQKGEIFLHFALAWFYAGKDKALEIQHLVKANSLVASQRSWDLSGFTREADVFVDMTDEDSLKVSQDSPVSDYSPVFIVTLPRSGATLLEQVLVAHPELNGIGESNAFYSANNLAAKALQSLVEESSSESEVLLAYLNNINQYFTENPLVAEHNGARIVDKSVTNATLVGLIKLVYPKAKIIYLQRDIRDVVLSCYKHYFQFGNEYIYDLEACFDYAVEHDRLMQKWQAIFKDDIFTLSYEDFVSDTESVAQRLFDYCGLTWDSAYLDFYKNDTVVKTASSVQVRKAISSGAVGQWREYEELLKPVIRKFESLDKG